MTSKIANVDELITKYIEEYNNRNNDFLLFDLAHANENSHTRVLLNILKYNNFFFLPSFLNCLGLPKCLDIGNNNIDITDQKEAISTTQSHKAKGFIDLYISYNDIQNKLVQVIIENKIYGAGDTKKQLARYVATLEGVEPTSFCNCWYKNPTINKNIHVIYLTTDGTKEPDRDSFPQSLETALGDKYRRVNYQDHILPWLEEDVLPNIPYSKDGMMIAGIRQYIAYLYSMRKETISPLTENYFSNITGNDVDKYNQIQHDIKTIGNLMGKKNDEDTILQSLMRELSIKAESIFNDDIKGLLDDWILHFTPSFFILYKQRWANLDMRKYSIPSLNLRGESKNLLNKRKTKLFAQVDHLPYEHSITNDNSINLALVNHNKTACFKLQKVDDIVCNDSGKRESRQFFYVRLIREIEDDIYKMDRATTTIEKYINDSGQTQFQVKLLEELIKLWKE